MTRIQTGWKWLGKEKNYDKKSYEASSSRFAMVTSSPQLSIRSKTVFDIV